MSTKPNTLAETNPAAPRFALPILGGASAGMWWSPGSGGKVARIFLGSYEKEQTVLMRGSMTPGCTFIDIGAHHGYYTLLAGKLAGPKGRVLAFEPDPENYAVLQKHRAWNALENVELVPAAVGRTKGKLTFAKGGGTGTGKLSPEGELEVDVLQLDEEISRRGLQPTHLKIDVEGAEMDVLQGGAETLNRFQPTLFLSTHGAEVHRDCCDLLKTLGYQLRPILGEDLETTTEVFATHPQAQRAAA